VNVTTLKVVVFCLMIALSIRARDVAAQSSRPSASSCDNYARNYANQASRQGQVLRRGAAGSLVGLGIGSIVGASGTGAAVGAAIGMIGGGMRRSSTADRMYDAAYQDCMTH
jgi:hypothetical protein